MSDSQRDAASHRLEPGRCGLVPGRPGPRVAVLAGGELVGPHAGLRPRSRLDMVQAEPVGQGDMAGLDGLVHRDRRRSLASRRQASRRSAVDNDSTRWSVSVVECLAGGPLRRRQLPATSLRAGSRPSHVVHGLLPRLADSFNHWPELATWISPLSSRTKHSPSPTLRAATIDLGAATTGGTCNRSRRQDALPEARATVALHR